MLLALKDFLWQIFVFITKCCCLSKEFVPLIIERGDQVHALVFKCYLRNTNKYHISSLSGKIDNVSRYERN